MGQYTMLAALTPQTDRQSVLVRVTRMWEAVNRKTNTILHTNVVLLDEEENHMIAIIRNNQRDTFGKQLQEGEVYGITNMKIVPGPKSYRTVNGDLSINFFFNTKIKKEFDGGSIPRFKFELQPFNQIKNLVGDVRSLIDVVGMIKTYGKLERRTNGAEKIDVILTNNRNEDMVVTLWEHHALSFLASIEAHDSAVFVVITGLLAKKFSSNASLSTTDATRVYYNIDYEPLNKLKQDMSDATGKAFQNLPPTTVRQFINSDDIATQELRIKSILELKLPQGKEMIRCICKAKIVDVLNGNGWYYICCPNCARTVRPLEGNYSCAQCPGADIQYTQRYRVVVRAEDDSGTTSFTLFNKEAEQIIGVPIQTLLNEEGEKEPMKELPTAVKNLIGRQCAFQIKVTTYNMTNGCEEYTVTRVTDCSPPSMAPINPMEEENPKKKQKCD